MAAPGRAPGTNARRGPGALEILDEAAALLRQAGLPALFVYYLGALPFALGLIYFCFEMSQSSDAERHLVPGALLLTALYLWLKTCQAVFSRRLLALLEGGDPEPWDAWRWVNTALLQCIYAATFFFVYPLALVITIPFGWVNAFYHNVSVLGTGRESTVRSTLAQAAELASLWPRQNHLALGTLLLASLFLFLNLAVLAFLLPGLLDTFFGIATVFDENNMAWNNSSLYVDVAVFCFLLLNPLNKAFYVLRCFYGRSRFDGADLLSELRRQRVARPELAAARALILAACLGALLPGVAHADAVAPPPPGIAAAAPAASLDQAIGKTLQKDEFAWRLPRTAAKEEEDGFFQKILDRLYDFVRDTAKKILKPIGKFLRWLFGGNRKGDLDADNWEGVRQFPWLLFFLVVLAVVVACVVFVLVRNFRRQAGPAPVSRSTPVTSIDLKAEDLSADALPDESWLALAHELWAKGESRLALRAFYLATLSFLAQRELIRLGAAKSNRDYLQEMMRRLRGEPGALGPFRENMKLFEASWYGDHPVTAECLETMLGNYQSVRTHVPA